MRVVLRAQARKIVGAAIEPRTLVVVEARSRTGRNILLSLLASVQMRSESIVVRGGSHISKKSGRGGRNRHRGKL